MLVHATFSDHKSSTANNTLLGVENQDIGFTCNMYMYDMSRCKGKPTICIGENKDADQLCSVTAKLISTFVFAARIV